MRTRRAFLKAAGFSTIFLMSQRSFFARAQTQGQDVKPLFPSLAPTGADELILTDGLKYDLLLKWDDKISKTERFGINNDFISWVEVPGSKDDLILWVNHEYPLPFLQHGQKLKAKTKEQVVLEQKSVGGSLLHMRKKSSSWSLMTDSKLNRRIDASTPIPFSGGLEISGTKMAVGTLANCAGGKTTWNTFLSCEENYSDYYKEDKFGWAQHFKYPDEHYGWVVEINPMTGAAKKLVSLGRFEHEGATFTLSPNKTPVVYMGDDSADEHLYKFISKKKDSLEEGVLYVANLEKGSWEELSLNNPKLKKHFKTDLEILIQTRVAAKLVGATPLDRPEDIEILKDGTVLVACTNNIAKGRPHGQILALQENGSNPESLSFKSWTWLQGGEDSGLSCPDNFTIDSQGHLWVTSDISEKLMGSTPYAERKNNGLFYIPTHGPHKGVVHQVASAPKDAEFTGPCFSPDFKTLFLCVQHPGARSDEKGYTSQWPTKGDKPRSALVTISGPLLDRLSGAKA